LGPLVESVHWMSDNNYPGISPDPRPKEGIQKRAS
jgi:hypothetical protein